MHFLTINRRRQQEWKKEGGSVPKGKKIINYIFLSHRNFSRFKTLCNFYHK
jgi:hypothetical protein